MSKQVRVIIVVIAVIVVAAVTLTIVLLNLPRTITLNDTPTSKTTPVFKPSPPAGFTQQTTGNNTGDGGVTGSPTLSTANSYTFTKKNQNTCTAQVYTTYLDPAFSKGDDAKLTNDYLISLTRATNSSKANTGTAYVKTTAGDDVAFATLSYTDVRQGATRSETDGTTVQNRIAVRAMNRVYTREVSGGGKSVRLKGLPVLVIHYQCIGGRIADNDWVSLLASQRVNLS